MPIIIGATVDVSLHGVAGHGDEIGGPIRAISEACVGPASEVNSARVTLPGVADQLFSRDTLKLGLLIVEPCAGDWFNSRGFLERLTQVLILVGSSLV